MRFKLCQLADVSFAVKAKKDATTTVNVKYRTQF